ncbi:MAG: protein kinase [Pirellulales bacterium]|nr:protein kinase [Pirellulales bacterium]
MSFNTSQSAYEDLRSIVAERSDPLIAWVGAGLSVAAGMPTWAQLRDLLVTELRKLAQAISDPETQLTLRRCADAAAVDPNLWNAFGLLKEKLGSESYKSAIRRAFRGAETCSIPPIYERLWKLGISGLLNLNIDRIATRAFTTVFGGKLLHEFSGERAGQFTHLLKGQVPWQAHLHGQLEDVSSWVFTASDLQRLFSQHGYDNLLSTCFSARTVVFVGITADDIAAGGHLRRLTQLGIDCGNHFWITHLGRDKRAWAEESGIRLIEYNARDGNHSELNELFDDLQQYKPVETAARPVRPKVPIESAEVPAPDELEQRSATDIRQILNAKASAILADTNEESINEFEQFASKYSEAIYRAWYVSLDPPKNNVLGYTLHEKCADGAFGTVYRATDSEERMYALKILHERVRSNREMLHSFRRGVQSMRILTEANLDGVVKYYNASEIPAMVAMDFIEGIDLAEAVRKGVLRDWDVLLKWAVRLAEIIRTSHRLPQRVLHRDIRPSNIMLEGCWGPDPKWEQVKLWVLDFDLSYHLDSLDVSISQPSATNGFLAPEQVDRSSGVSTRNAAVDSFGIGMTLYFMRSAIEPRFGQHRYSDWNETLQECARKHPCAAWESLPNRFGRLIHSATRDKQEQRLDVARIEDELVRLRDAATAPERVASAELLAEEIAARAFPNRYSWNSDRLQAQCDMASIKLVVEANEDLQQVICTFQWLKTGGEHHQNVKKWLPRAKDRALAALRVAGWEVRGTINTGQISGEGRIGVSKLRGNVEKSAAAVAEVFQALQFE